MVKITNTMKISKTMKISGIKMLRWVSTTSVILFFRKTVTSRKNLGRVNTQDFLNRSDEIIFYNELNNDIVFNLIRQIKKETEMLLTNNEAYQVYMAVKRTKKIKGDIAEVGVYKGGSAKIVCEVKGNRHLHLFDTFEGLPEVGDFDTFYCKGQYKASYKDVKKYLQHYPNVHFYKGMFPKTAKQIRHKKFSFVNLDVDIYESTLNCLKFFYPRLTKGGILISHDYSNSSGVKKAFEEFFTDKPEPIIELIGSQCLIIKK